MRRQREGGRTTKTAFEVKLRSKARSEKIIKKLLFFFDSKDILKGPSRTASLLAQALLCFPLKLGCALPPLKSTCS